jgi:DNA-binding IclR family transcriptional regulator
MDSRPTPSYPIASVDNALKLLLMFRTRHTIRLTEASEALGVAHSTAHRLLAMLEHYGFVQRESDSRGYRTGPTLVEIGLSAVGTLDIRNYARPFLEQLRDEVGETTYLAVLKDRSLVFIDSAESNNLLRLADRTGQVAEAHLSATGRVLLAERSDEEIRHLYRSASFAETTRWVKNLDDLIEEVHAIRVRGYALNLGDPEPGVSAVAVAIRDRFRTARAGLAVGAPEIRLPESRAEQVAKDLLKTAARMGEGLL